VQKTLFYKLAAIGFLVLLLLIPLKMIEGVIGARQMRQHEVEQTVAASSAGSQVLIGPVLAVPYIERCITRTVDEKMREKTTVTETEKLALFMPETLEVDNVANIEEKYKGLYKTFVFENRGKWRATFKVPANLGLDIDPKLITPGRAYLSMGMSDVRGILGRPNILWDGQPLTVAQGTRLNAFPQGVHADIGKLDTRLEQRFSAGIGLHLIGTSTLSFAPVGESVTVRMQSPWAHPNFTGRFLPRERKIGESGFSARWETTHFASNNNAILKQTALSHSDDTRVRAAPGIQCDTFGVTFMEPVNIYLQAERAVKYGILFVVLTFAGFFILETLKKLRIHPLQYGLVGLALAVFFLLVISLTEHISFALAYLAASTACIALLGYYLTHVLKSRLRGMTFAALFTLLYGVLYALLLSEDNALALGAILLFAALAAIMVLTRNVDWYHAAIADPKEGFDGANGVAAR
jgi:inner membrane protein